MNNTLEECYQILGVGLNSTPEEIKKAYKTQALACHPDKNPDDPDAVRKFQELGYAYKKITSDEKDEKDEKEEDLRDLFSNFNYWMEFFIYCMYEEAYIVDLNGGKHFCGCGNCDYSDEDDSEDEFYCWKHHKKYKEETFTKEEMKRFVKFNSLEEQREFNKKIFCNSKKTKEKKEHQIQKPKGKSNKQLKAEEWKRQKEISKIAEEIEIKRKQQEEKLEQSKERLVKKNKKEDSLDSLTVQDASRLPPSKPTLSSVHKVKSKKKKRRGRGKNGNKVIEDSTNKSHQQHEMPCDPVTKKAVETRINHEKPNIPVLTKKPSNTKIPSTQSRPVSKPTTVPSSAIPAPQPPNIWQRRMENQIEIQQILPSNEEEELKQLQMALEMSKNLAEMEEQQKQIAALQEELKLISLGQDNVKLDLSESYREEESQELDKVPLDVTSVVSNNSSGFGNKGSKNNEGNMPTKVQNNTSSLPQNVTKNLGTMVNSKSDSHSQQTKGQHSSLYQWEERRVCPYGRNCCLGKRCTKFHPSSKRSHRLVENRIEDEPSIVKIKNGITCSELESELLDDSKECEQGMSGNQIISKTAASQVENWDDEIDTNGCETDNGTLSWGSQGEEEGLSSDHTCSNSDYEDKTPLSSKTFNMTEKSTENWDNELEDEQPSITMKTVGQNGDAMQSQNIEHEIKPHPLSSINVMTQGFKRESEIGGHCVANGRYPGFTQRTGQMSSGITHHNYIPTYPIKGNLVHPVMTRKLNGGIRPVQPTAPMFGMDVLSGLTATSHLIQTNLVMNPVNNTTASQQEPLTSSFTSRNSVLTPSAATLFSTVPAQGSFNPGSTAGGGFHGLGHVQIDGPVLSSASNLSESKSPKLISGAEHQTSANSNSILQPSSCIEINNGVTGQTTHQVKATSPKSNIEHSNSQDYGSQYWENACPVNPPNTSTHPGSNFSIPGLSMPVIQNMNPMFPLFPGLPLPQQSAILNRCTSAPIPKVSTGIQNPSLMGLPYGVPLSNGMNLASLMALEAQYLNMLQLQCSSMTTNQQTNPCKSTVHSTQGEPAISKTDVEIQTDNRGSNIRKPVTVPRVLSFVESR